MCQKSANRMQMLKNTWVEMGQWVKIYISIGNLFFFFTENIWVEKSRNGFENTNGDVQWLMYLWQ
jgi:hypothetical protein